MSFRKTVRFTGLVSEHLYSLRDRRQKGRERGGETGERGEKGARKTFLTLQVFLISLSYTKTAVHE